MEFKLTILLSLLGIIVSLLGSVGFGYLFYKLALKKKILTCDINTICLISENISHINGLSINYNSTNLNSLYCSTIKIKNSGNTIIDKSDIASKAPLVLSTNGKFLYDKHIIQLANDEDNIQLKYKTNKTGICSIALIDFDFISKKRAIEFSILHTKSINFNGRIKDGNIIKTNSENDIIINNSKKVQHMKKRYIAITVSSLVICIFSFIFSLIYYQKRTEEFIHDFQANTSIVDSRTLELIGNYEFSIFKMENDIKTLEAEIEKLHLQLNTESNEPQTNMSTTIQ